MEMTRFDTRLTKKQKELFEYASQVGGFKTLTEFILSTVQAKAEEILKEHHRILASQKDQEIFFNFLLNPAEPNEALKNAFENYKKN